MPNLTMTTLVKAMQENTDLSEKQIRIAIKGLVSQIQGALKEENGSVTIPGLGTFRSKQKGDRMARNPKTGEQSYVEPYLKGTFKASELFQDVINGNR